MSGRRILEFNGELLVNLLKDMSEGGRRLEVVKDPLPADARIVSVGYSMYRPSTIEIVLESDQWEPTQERTYTDPTLRSYE